MRRLVPALWKHLHFYSTRSSLGDPLFVPQYLVMHSRQSFPYIGPKIYNDVPMEIKLLNNPESFKYNLKIFIMYTFLLCMYIFLLH